MTTNEDVILPAPPFADRMRERLSALGARMAFSEVTPVVVSLVGVLFVLSLAGAAFVAQRLEEMAFDGAVRPTGLRTGASSAQAQAFDFTLSPEEIRPISEDEARAYNAGVPFSTLPILSAKPFIMPADRLEDYSRALDCLTAAVYYEAASETGEGQAAVAQVVLNRMRHPAYPKTVCGVVFQGSERQTGCQFTFTCDGALARTPSPEGWARARAVAAAALNGSVAAGVGMATHYHTDWVAPYWADRLVKMRQIGAHIFYRWAGTWGLPGAFTGRHAEAEPVIAQMAALASPVEALDVVVAPSLDVASLDPIALPVMAPVVAVAPDAGGTDAPAADQAVEPAPVAAPPPPAPAVMANPLAPPQASQPQRRRRIAAPF